MSDHALDGGTARVHPVDQKLPGGRLAALGMQHVLVMYAGAVAVPLIVGRALNLAPEQVAMLMGPIPMAENANYGALDTMGVAAFVLAVILLLVRYGRGFVANIAVLLGIVVGCVMAVAMGKAHFDKVANAHWFDIVTPFAFGMPTFDPVMVLTMALVMVVVMIVFVLGGAGLVRFGMVAATGIRILGNVDFRGNRNNLYIVALSIGFGLMPLIARRWMQHMAHSLHPLLESGILLTAISAVALNLYFNGGKEDKAGAIKAAKAAEAH